MPSLPLKTQIVDAEVRTSIIGDGCVIKAGSRVSDSVVGLRSLIGHDCVLDKGECTHVDGVWE